MRALLRSGLMALAVLTTSTTLAQESAPPPDSWEAWILALPKNSDKAPPRPDKRLSPLPLPLWVDCHLSWRFERAARAKKTLSLPGDLVLRTEPSDCEGQIERWAR
jgi:hypothetical protein